MIEDKRQLEDDLGATAGGDVVRNHICEYLWRHK